MTAVAQRFDALHAVAEHAPEFALLAAVVRVALTDAQGGDLDAASWLASDQCRALCSLLIPADADQSFTGEQVQTRLLGHLPTWMHPHNAITSRT